MSAKTAIPSTSTERSGLSGLKRARLSSDSEDNFGMEINPRTTSNLSQWDILSKLWNKILLKLSRTSAHSSLVPFQLPVNNINIDVCQVFRVLDDIATKRSCIYVLAPESDLESDSGTESILSIQDKSTDIVKSPTDTCSSYSWTSRNSSGTFIDVEVVAGGTERFFDCLHIQKSSSTSDDTKPLAAGSPIVKHSSSNSSGQTVDDESLSELDEKDRKWTFKYCLSCKLLNSNPYFRYCQKCYLLRKSYLPMRPCRKRRQMRVDLLSDACKLDSADSGIVLSQSQSFQDDIDEMKIDPTGELCQICLIRRKDGGFCHGNIIHVYSCFKCSVRAYKQSGRCPVCNIKTRQIFKVVSV